MSVQLTTANFDELVLNSDTPVLVDFYADWCGPCKVLGPIVDELATDYDGRAVVGKVNIDEWQELAARYGVRSIPTVLFIKDGEVVDKSVGLNQKNVLAEKLDAQL